MTKEEKVKKHNDFCGVTEWHDKGFKGQGITVWNCEKRNKSHGKQTANRVLDSAPECNLVLGSISIRTKVGRKEVAECNVVDEKGIKHNIYDWIENNNVRIITASLENLFKESNRAEGKFWQSIVNKYNIILINSAGNDGDKKFDFSKRVAWLIGALGLDAKNNVKRQGYSSTGDGLDFADFAGWNNGTSFSAPYFAGKCALVLQRYPDFTPAQVYEYMKKYSMDLEAKGEDEKTGWGLPILPPIEEIEIEEKQDEPKKESETKPITKPNKETSKENIGKKTKFSDVAAGSWYEDAIAFSVEKEILKGISNTKFDPEGQVTRAQLAQVIYNAYHVIHKELKK